LEKVDSSTDRVTILAEIRAILRRLEWRCSFRGTERTQLGVREGCYV
jgi:hypothetical protein